MVECRPDGYPEDYRACPICRVELGKRCRSLSGNVVAGRPDNVTVDLDHPHVARKRRVHRRRSVD